jgi:hypothetical protein
MSEIGRSSSIPSPLSRINSSAKIHPEQQIADPKIAPRSVVVHSSKSIIVNAKNPDDCNNNSKERRLQNKDKNSGHILLKRNSTSNWSKEQRKRVTHIEEEIALKIFSDKTITQAFRSADDDRSGEIDKDEFRNLLEENKIICSDDDYELLWNRYDADGGGAVTMEEFTMQYSFSAALFKEYLDNKEEEQEKCRSLPLTIVFFIVFVVLVAFHEMTTEIFELEHSLRIALTGVTISAAGDIEFDEINSAEDIYDWASEVLFPTIFEQIDPVSGTPIDPEDWDRVLTYSHLVGSGIVMAQTRSDTQTCYIQEISNVYGQCHPESTSDMTPFGLPLCNNYSEYELRLNTNETCACIGGEALDCVPSDIDNPAYEDIYDDVPYLVVDDTNDGGALDDYFTQMFYYDLPLNYSLAKLDVLHKRAFVDENTKELKFSFALYNPEMLVYTKVDTSFIFNRGGHVEVNYDSKSLLADAYHSPWLIALDALWTLMVLSLAWSEIQEMRDTAGCTKKGLEDLEKQGDKRTTAQRYCDYWQDGWNYIDWAQVLMTLFLSGFWLWIYTETIAMTAHYLTIANDTDPAVQNTIIWDLERIAVDAQIYRTIAVLNLFVLMLRFFKAFLGQPRLAIITRTFALAASDLLHFFVVFLCLFFTFVFASMFIFGQHLYNYHSVHTAMATSFNALTGEYEWEEVENVDLNMAIIWWWVFMMLMYLVVLNMLLAIVLNAYNAAKRSATRQVTCWKQVVDSLRETIAGLRGSIKLSEIQDILEEFSDECNKNDAEETDPINAFTVMRVWEKLKRVADVQISEYARSFAKTYLLSLVAEYVASLKFDQERKDRLSKYAAIQRTRQLGRDFSKLTKQLDAVTEKLEELRRQ